MFGERSSPNTPILYSLVEGKYEGAIALFEFPCRNILLPGTLVWVIELLFSRMRPNSQPITAQIGGDVFELLIFFFDCADHGPFSIGFRTT